MAPSPGPARQGQNLRNDVSRLRGFPRLAKDKESELSAADRAQIAPSKGSTRDEVHAVVGRDLRGDRAVSAMVGGSASSSPPVKDQQDPPDLWQGRGGSSSLRRQSAQNGFGLRCRRPTFYRPASPVDGGQQLGMQWSTSVARLGLGADAAGGDQSTGLLYVIFRQIF
jgi:hypothetical protein